MAPGARTLTAVGVATVVTMLAAAVPLYPFRYPQTSLQLVVETGEGVVGALAAYLIVGRFRRSAAVSDLTLAIALALLATANLGSSVARAVIVQADHAAVTWAALVTRVTGAALLAVASLVPERPLRDPERLAARAAALAVAWSVLVPAAAVFLTEHLPAAFDARLLPEVSRRLVPVGHPVVVALQGVVMGCFALAAFGFLHRAERTGDELASLLSAGCVLAAFARVHYLVFPSLYSRWVYSGDLLRLGFYLLLLAGAVREIQRYWRGLADAAVLEERRRVARNIHDGLAQELAFISRHTASLRKRFDGDQELEWVAGAARRALDDSRRAISVLAEPGTQRLDVLIARTAEELAGRTGIDVALDLMLAGDVSAETREEALRIVREAVSNAATHSNADVVRVRLRHVDGQVLLRVSDDGVGFDPAAEEAGRKGFGLTSMRERAAAIGGDCEVSSSPGAGTIVEVRLPSWIGPAS